MVHPLSPRRPGLRRLAVAAAAAVIVPVVIATPAQGSAQGSAPGSSRAGATSSRAVDVVVRLGDLDRRSKPLELAWLVGRVLHRTDGSTLQLPWTVAGARERSLRLLGKTAEGWLVKDFTGDRWNVWSVSHGERTLLSEHGVTEGDIVGITLSSDRQRYAVRYYSGDPSENLVSVRDLDGDVVASRDFPNDASVLAFSGDRAVIGTADTQVWDVDGDTSEALGRDAGAADLTHGLAFVYTTGSDVGPTPVDAPDDPTWSAPMVQAEVSPGGGLVLSRPALGHRVFVVRDVETGASVISFRIRYPTGLAALWESDRAFVLVGTVDGLGDKQVLARCTVTGHCARVSAVQSRDTISLPAIG